jgi:ribosomal protein S7
MKVTFELSDHIGIVVEQHGQEGPDVFVRAVEESGRVHMERIPREALSLIYTQSMTISPERRQDFEKYIQGLKR